MVAPRMPWLDWQRGLAVFFMIEVHLVNGWTNPNAGGGLARDALELLGGLAAPGFLFMAGLSQALADRALAARGVGANERRRRHLARALYVLGIAYAFRAAEYVLGGAFLVRGGWRDLFRVDVLNAIGVSLALTALVTVGRPARVHIVSASLAALAVVLLAPSVAANPSWHLGGYLYVPPGDGFGLCNWAAFTFAGSAVGVLVGREMRPLGLSLLAAALTGIGFGLEALMPSSREIFWSTSSAWFSLRLGATVGLSAALMLVPPGRGLVWLSLLGRHSLAIYMVSVELTYGLLFKPWHGTLSVAAVAAAIVLMTAAMVLLAWALEGRSERRFAPAGGAVSSS